MSGHTKGPWEARDQGLHRHEWHVGQPAVGAQHTLARVYTPMLGAESKAVAAANASLIAAAPELLNVAHEAAWAFEGILDEEQIEHDECAATGGFDLCGARPCQESGCIVDKLRRAKAAIAKATGAPLQAGCR